MEKVMVTWSEIVPDLFFGMQKEKEINDSTSCSHRARFFKKLRLMQL